MWSNNSNNAKIQRLQINFKAQKYDTVYKSAIKLEGRNNVFIWNNKEFVKSHLLKNQDFVWGFHSEKWRDFHLLKQRFTVYMKISFKCNYIFKCNIPLNQNLKYFKKVNFWKVWPSLNIWLENHCHLHIFNEYQRTHLRGWVLMQQIYIYFTKLLIKIQGLPPTTGKVITVYTNYCKSHFCFL